MLFSLVPSDKKYKLTNIKKEVDGVTLHRIKALKSFGAIKKGDLGGWVESEENLSQKGNCWLYDDAIACDLARVYDNAKMFNKSIANGCSKIHDFAKIYGNVTIDDDADVKGHANISGTVQIKDKVYIDEYAKICGNVIIRDNACICGRADIYGIGECIIGDCVKIYGDAHIKGIGCIVGYSEIFGYSKINNVFYISGNVKIYGVSRIEGNVRIRFDADIKDTSDYISITGTGLVNFNNTLTFFRCSDGTIKTDSFESTYGSTLSEIRDHILLNGKDLHSLDEIEELILLLNFVEKHFALSTNVEKEQDT